MQTFLPYPDFTKSARVLDDKRLGKQRVECVQLLDTMKYGGGWEHHPVVRMWRGYRNALKLYLNAVLHEWENVRGFRNDAFWFNTLPPTVDLPPWIGDPAFHASHRAALLFKSPDHYSRFGWTEAPRLDYVWPVASS